jgi:catechol 2,3-dioxygenase-like lactoylglutathione lyase family enzyme
MKFVNVRLLTGDFSAALTFWRDIMGLDMTYQGP